MILERPIQRKEGKMKSRSNYTPRELIQLWSDHQAGATSKIRPGPLCSRSGGPTGLRESAAAAIYVEGTPGFDLIRPILKWVFAPTEIDSERGGGQWSTVMRMYPGMTCFRVLLAFGRCDLVNQSPCEWARVLIEDFEGKIADRMKQRRFEFFPEEPGE